MFGLEASVEAEVESLEGLGAIVAVDLDGSVIPEDADLDKRGSVEGAVRDFCPSTTPFLRFLLSGRARTSSALRLLF